ncbi:MAG: hypothetical protein F6Q13_18105, partial [Mycobacterium sp.]
MSRRHRIKSRLGSGEVGSRRGARVVGVGATAGAFWAAAMGAGAPEARADLLDAVLDPLMGAAAAAGAGLSDASGPAADAGTVAASLGGLDAVLAGLVQELNATVNGLAQDWITNPIGSAVDSVVNAPSVFLFGRDLIGNGINDFTGANTSLLGSSGMFGNLSDGGFLVGNGGTGVAGIDGGTGGVGGSAGLIGDGG